MKQSCAAVKNPPAVFTTQPVEADKNWGRMPRPKEHLCGLSRSHLYELCKTGTIQTVSLRRGGRKRGVRLIFLPSVYELLDKLKREQNPTVEATSIDAASRLFKTDWFPELCEKIFKEGGKMPRS